MRTSTRQLRTFHASERVVDNGELRVGVLFRETPDFSSARNEAAIA
jgi:hypothetical protein